MHLIFLISLPAGTGWSSGIPRPPRRCRTHRREGAAHTHLQPTVLHCFFNVVDISIDVDDNIKIVIDIDVDVNIKIAIDIDVARMEIK